MKRTRRPALALCYISILTLAALLRYKPPYYAAHLFPLDAMEYAVSGAWLYKTGTFALMVNHVAYPPQYPYGFPLLLLPAFALFGPVAHYALWAALFYSVALVVVVMLLAQRLFGHGAALVAGLFMALSRRHIASSQEIMSDAASAAVTLLAAYWVMRGAESRRLRDIFGGGFLAGLVVSIRYGDVIALFALALAVLIVQRGAWDRALRSLLALAAGAALWIAPLLAYNWTTFGSPFATGYQHWFPFFQRGPVFSLRYLVHPSSPPMIGTIRYYLRGLLGIDSSFYMLPFVLAIVVGAVVLMRQGTRRQKQGMLVLGILALANIGIYSVYWFEDLRFLYVSTTVLIMVGAYGCVELARPFLGRGRGFVSALVGGAGNRPLLVPGPWGRVVYALALSAIVVSVLLMGIYDVRINYLFRTYVRHVFWWDYPWEYEVVRYLDEHTPDNAVIITALAGPYVEHYVIKQTDRFYVPVRRKGMQYAPKPPARSWIVADEQPEWLGAALRQGRPVYVVDDPGMAKLPNALEPLRRRFVLHTQVVRALGNRGWMTVYRLALPD